MFDLGCGTGVHLAHYLELGASKVVGLDLSELMLKQAESCLAKIGKNRPLSHCTACQWNN
ncbi:SAM-dependent methyltransferase [Actinobacillus equuli]|nr:SAM-dependent methyltransferase [Actinobacillus equuli]